MSWRHFVVSQLSTVVIPTSAWHVVARNAAVNGVVAPAASPCLLGRAGNRKNHQRLYLTDWLQTVWKDMITSCLPNELSFTTTGQRWPFQNFPVSCVYVCQCIICNMPFAGFNWARICNAWREMCAKLIVVVVGRDNGSPWQVNSDGSYCLIMNTNP